MNFGKGNFLTIPMIKLEKGKNWCLKLLKLFNFFRASSTKTRMLPLTFTSSYAEVIRKKLILFCEISQNFLEKKSAPESLSLSLSFLINFITCQLRHMCFPMKCAKFFRTAFLQNIFEKLLLGCLCCLTLSSIFSFYTF